MSTVRVEAVRTTVTAGDTRSEEESRIRAHIAAEPGFRVTTLDGAAWICPYTLKAVPVPFDVVDSAVDSLLSRRPWGRYTPRSLGDIQVAAWAHWLKDRYASEPRLRFYGPDGRWLNPFTGDWIGGIPDPSRSAPTLVMEALARHLAACAPAQAGRLISSQQLAETVRQSRSISRDQTRTPAPAPVAEPSSSTTTLHRARGVIERMLPAIPALPGFTLAVHYEPVQEIGGDFYDFIDLGEGRLLIVLADVAGHGPEAALVVSAGLKALRMLAPLHRGDLVALLAALNDNLRPDLAAGHFITCWAAVLDQRARTLTSVCAGHHPALLCNVDRQMILHQVGRKGTAIGVVPGSILQGTLRPETIPLQPGDLLLQFTDGLHEVHDAKGREFGRLRAMAACVACLDHPPVSLVRQVVGDAKAFAGAPLPDDLTVLALAVA